MRIMASLVLLLAALSQPAAARSPLAPETTSETAALLAEIIRVDTSNPPGNEARLAELLAAKFRPLGFEIDIIPTPQEGKSHFVARLRGNGTKEPVLLAAHADVVGVEREKWTVDPFGGVIQGRVRARSRRHRLQGWSRRLRRGGDAAREEQGSPRARRDLPIGGGRRRREVQHPLARRDPLGQDRVRVRAQRGRLDHGAPRWTGALREHLHRRQELGLAGA